MNRSPASTVLKLAPLTRVLNWLLPFTCLRCKAWLKAAHGFPYFCEMCWRTLPWLHTLTPIRPRKVTITPAVHANTPAASANAAAADPPPISMPDPSNPNTNPPSTNIPSTDIPSINSADINTPAPSMPFISIPAASTAVADPPAPDPAAIDRPHTNTPAPKNPRLGTAITGTGVTFAPLLHQEHLDRLHAAFHYLPPLMHWIWQLKYRRQLPLLEALSWGLAAATPLQQCWLDIDCIMPVPLHRTRLRLRGYNQAQLLAHRWWRIMQRSHRATQTDCPSFNDKVLLRTRATPSQTQFSAEARLDNVKAAFAVHIDRRSMQRNRCGELRLPWRRILLIDDVITTAATLSSCAAVLKAHGAERVEGLVLAQVPLMPRRQRSSLKGADRSDPS